MIEANASRRSFLQGGIFLCTSLAVTLSGKLAFAAVHDTLASRIVALFRHREAALALGTAVLNEGSVRKNSAELVQIIAGSETAVRRLTKASHEELCHHIKWRTQHDFKAGRALTIGGWRISQTEAAATALVALGVAPDPSR